MIRTFTAFALAAAVALTPSLGLAQDKGGTTGKVNRVDPAKHVINLTHGPIAAIGWPAMTMDFGVAPSIDLKPFKVGDTVAFTVAKSAGGVWLIDKIEPEK